MENPRDINDGLVRITQPTPRACRHSLLCLTLLALIGILSLTRGIADTPPPIPAERLSCAEASTLVFRADTPQTVWDGWGFASPLKPNSSQEPAPAPKPEQFETVEKVGDAPRTFSGKVAGLDSMDGVEVGLVSLVGVHWVKKDAYQWEPVAADGSFSLTDARYNDAGKALVLRGPNTAWTFLRYDFDPSKGGTNIVLNAAPSKKVRLTASGADMENLTNLGVEPFYAYTKFNDRGAALRRQRLGIYTSQNNKQVEVLLPLGEVALYVTRAGWASFYQIVDTRKADHFHFVLNPAGHLKIRVLDKEGNPQPGVRADWVNPTAPLSISGATTAENGELRADSLVPGIFQVTISGFGGYRIEVQGGSETEVILQEGKAPAISLSKFHPTPAARPPASTDASPSSGENSRAKTMKKPEQFTTSADPGLVSDWYLTGTRLSADAVSALEKQVDSKPNNLEARMKILGYYFVKRSLQESARAASQPHILWIIRNLPDSAAASTHEAQGPDMRIDPARYEEARNAWSEQVAKQPKNAQTLGNAARFFTMNDKPLAEKLLRQAQALDPSNLVWAERLGQFFSLQAMTGDAATKSGDNHKAFESYEAALPAKDAKGDKEGDLRFYKLTTIAKAAFNAGDLTKARAYSEELLGMAPGFRANWNYGNAIYTGNSVLGLVALSQDDLKSAGTDLLAASETPGSPQLNSFGPDLTLAKELLRRGEKETVLTFLGNISKFWQAHDAKIKEWQETIRQGQLPQFGPLY